MNLKDHVEKKGYVVVNSFFERGELDSLKDRLRQYANSVFGRNFKSFDEMNLEIPQLAEKYPEKRRFFFDICQLSPEINEICFSPKIKAALKNLEIKNPVLKNTNIRLDVINTCDFFLVDWHQDLNNLDSEKSFTFWMPLQDISEETGGVSVVDMDQFEEKKWPGVLNEKNYETVSIETIPNSSCRDVHMKEGDLLIFNPFLVHKSFRGQSKIRWTLIVRFDCLDKFYQITGNERKSKRFTTADPYLKAKSVQDLY